jgi:hypothetical protein
MMAVFLRLHWKKDWQFYTGKFYLGNAGYPLRSFLLTLFRGVRYHLKEWSRSNQRPANKEELFNLRHSSLRNIIERSFGIIKWKFQILQRMPKFPFTTQVQIVLAAFIVQSLLVKLNENDDWISVQLQDDNIEPTMSEYSETEQDNVMSDIRNEIAEEMWRDYIMNQA